MPCSKTPFPQTSILLILLRRFRLLLVRLPSQADALQNLLPVLVELEFGNLDLAGGDPDGYALAVALLAAHTLDVNDVFEAVDGGDLALAAFVGAALDDDFVVFADGESADLNRFVVRILKIRGFEKWSCRGGGELRTLCFSRSSLLNEALINVLRTLEGAV